MKTKPSREPRLRPRMRVLCGEEIALGPGKVDLLAVVAETGSIREAAERMGMSYNEVRSPKTNPGREKEC